MRILRSLAMHNKVIEVLEEVTLVGSIFAVGARTGQSDKASLLLGPLQ